MKRIGVVVAVLAAAGVLLYLGVTAAAVAIYHHLTR